MIGINSYGRLGNQLFQYAFGLELREKSGVNFYLFEMTKFYAHKYFQLDDFSYKKNKLTYLKHRFLLKKRPSITLNQWNAPVEILKTSFPDNYRYFGYFQSEQYFEGIKKRIHQIYKIRKEYQVDPYELLKLDKQKPYIAIHIRRRDYLNFGDHTLGGKNLALPFIYYRRSMEALKNINDYTVVFVSDDIDFVKKNFSVPNAVYSTNCSEIEDFQVIKNADVIICANSSFSWWAAYLNTKATHVFAPEYWLGFKVKREYPCGITPPNWHKVSID